MSEFQQIVQPKATITVSGLSTLTSGAYVTSPTIDNTTNHPSDLLVELYVTPGTTSANKQIVISVQNSLDGTDWTTGGTGAVSDDILLTPLGVVGVPVNSVPQRAIFSVMSVCMFIAPFVRFVINNDSGAALTAATLKVSEVKYVSV